MAHRSLLIPHRYHHNNNFNFYLKEHNLKHSENLKGASCKYVSSPSNRTSAASAGREFQKKFKFN